MTAFNSNKIMKIQKISRRRSCSSDYAENGHFTLFSYAEDDKEMYKHL